MEDASAGGKFVDELNWCIKQLELGLQRQSPDSRQTQESLKILKILKSTKAPMVKKRQAMRNALGDYRKKMNEEEKKSRNAMKVSKFKLTHNKKFFGKSKFIRHSHSKEAVFERENEENRLLSMTMDSLNLHQVQGASSDLECASTLSSQTGLSSSSEADNVGFHHPVNGLTNTRGDDGISLPGPADITDKSLCSGGNKFKFCPSDNSFLFSFEGDISEEVKHSNTSEIVNNIDGSKCQSNSNSDSANEKFKFEKSDNSFSFNFNS